MAFLPDELLVAIFRRLILAVVCPRSAADPGECCISPPQQRGSLSLCPVPPAGSSPLLQCLLRAERAKRQLISLALVCHTWLRVASDESLWRLIVTYAQFPSVAMLLNDACRAVPSRMCALEPARRPPLVHSWPKYKFLASLSTIARANLLAGTIHRGLVTYHFSSIDQTAARGRWLATTTQQPHELCLWELSPLLQRLASHRANLGDWLLLRETVHFTQQITCVAIALDGLCAVGLLDGSVAIIDPTTDSSTTNDQLPPSPQFLLRSPSSKAVHLSLELISTAGQEQPEYLLLAGWADGQLCQWRILPSDLVRLSASSATLPLPRSLEPLYDFGSVRAPPFPEPPTYGLHPPFPPAPFVVAVPPHASPVTALPSVRVFASLSTNDELDADSLACCMDKLNNEVVVWNLSKRQTYENGLRLGGNRAGVFGLAIDYPLLLVLLDDGSCRVWDLIAVKCELRSAAAAAATATATATTTTTTTATTPDATTRVFEKALAELTPPPGAGDPTAFCANAGLLAIGFKRGTVALWELPNPTDPELLSASMMLPIFSLKHGSQRIASLHISDDSEFMLCSTSNGQMCVAHTGRREWLYTIDTGSDFATRIIPVPCALIAAAGPDLYLMDFLDLPFTFAHSTTTTTAAAAAAAASPPASAVAASSIIGGGSGAFLPNNQRRESLVPLLLTGDPLNPTSCELPASSPLPSPAQSPRLSRNNSLLRKPERSQTLLARTIDAVCQRLRLSYSPLSDAGAAGSSDGSVCEYSPFLGDQQGGHVVDVLPTDYPDGEWTTQHAVEQALATPLPPPPPPPPLLSTAVGSPRLPLPLDCTGNDAAATYSWFPRASATTAGDRVAHHEPSGDLIVTLPTTAIVDNTTNTDSGDGDQQTTPYQYYTWPAGLLDFLGPALSTTSPQLSSSDIPSGTLQIRRPRSGAHRRAILLCAAVLLTIVLGLGLFESLVFLYQFDANPGAGVALVAFETLKYSVRAISHVIHYVELALIFASPATILLLVAYAVMRIAWSRRRAAARDRLEQRHHTMTLQV